MNNKPLNNTTPTFNNKVVVSGNKVVSKEKIRYKYIAFDKNGKQILPFGSVDDYSWYHGSEIIKDSTVDDKWYILTEEVDGTLRLNIIDYNNL